MTDRELIQQWMRPGAIVPVDINTVRILITALRERLAQPEQKPVAWMGKDVLPLAHIIKAVVRREKDETYTEPLYTTPQPRHWVGLTDEEILTIYGSDLNYRDGDYLRYARAIEANLKEKNA